MCKYASTKVIKITTQQQADVMNKLLRRKGKVVVDSGFVYPAFDINLWIPKKNAKNTITRKRS